MAQDDPGIIEMARDVLRAPFEERRARREAARTRRLALQAQAKTLEQTVKRVHPEDDEFSIPVLGEGTVGDLPEGKTQDLRTQARKASMRSPLIVGYLRTLKQFVVGSGPQITPVLEDDEAREEIQDWWDKFKKINDWESLEEEIPHRTWRDGECFIHKTVQESSVGKPTDNLTTDTQRHLRRMGVEVNEELSTPDIPQGMVQVRLLPPEQIEDPRQKISYGIVTASHDVQTVLGYLWAPGDELERAIPADAMEHVKIRTDSSAKRGRSLLEPLLKLNKQYEDWLESRIILNYVRSAVVLVRKVEGASPSQLSSLVEQQRASRSASATNDRKAEAFEPGTVMSANQGVEYEFKNPNLQASDAAKDGREIKLNMATAANQPEYVFTGDASNANFASTMVAESPGVREYESWQDFFGPIYRRIFRWVTVEGAEHQDDFPISVERAREMEIEVAFPPMIHRDELDQAKANQLRNQAGILSKEGWAKKSGIDWETEKQRIEQERQEAVEFTAPVQPDQGQGGQPPGQGAGEPQQQNGGPPPGDGQQTAPGGEQPPETEEAALDEQLSVGRANTCPEQAPYGLMEGDRCLECHDSFKEAVDAQVRLQRLRDRFAGAFGRDALRNLQEVIRRRPDLCSESKPWALLTQGGDRVLGCHSSRAEAERQELAIRLNQAEESGPGLIEAELQRDRNALAWELEEAHAQHGQFFVVQDGEPINISDLPGLGDSDQSADDVPDEVALMIRRTDPDHDRTVEVEVLSDTNLRGAMEVAAERIEGLPDEEIVKIKVAPAVGRLGGLTVYGCAARLRRSRQVQPSEDSEGTQ